MATEITPSPIWSLGSVDVDGLSDARRISHKTAYEMPNGTLAFTVTPDSSGGRQGLFSKDHEYFGDGGHFTVWIDDGRILARLQSEDRSYELAGGDVKAGEPLAVAVSFGEGGYKLYVDGDLVDQSSYRGGLQGNSEPIVVGASQWASSESSARELDHEFKGQITDIELYDEALSAVQVGTLADPGAAPEPEPQPDPQPEPGSSAGVWLGFDGSLDASGAGDAWVADSKARAAYAWDGDDGAYHLTGDNSIRFERSDEVFYDREDFHIGLSLQKTASGGAGAFLHLHETLEAEVDAAGRVIFTLSTSKGDYSVASAAGVLDDTAEHQIDVRFGDGALALAVDGATVAETAAGGVTAPAKYWGLHVGHDWNQSVDAYVDDFVFEDLDAAGSAPPAPQPDPAPEPDPEPQPVPQPEPQPEPENSAPAVTGSLGTIGLDEGDRRTVDVSRLFSDADGDALSYQLTGAPGFMTLSGKTLTIAPKDGDDGSFDFALRASDGEDTSPALAATVDVADAIRATSGGSSGGGSVPSGPVTLKAGPGILQAGKVGAQDWGKGVVLEAFDLGGKVAEVAYSERFQDHGIGVKGPGSRWDGQIDYYEKGSGGPRSEKLVIDFNGDVTDVTLRVGMLGASEGPGGNPETGTWAAYDDGKLVGRGLIGPEVSSGKESGTYGTFPIGIDPGAAFDELEIEATQFGHGAGRSVDMSYGENSSDINVMGVEFLRLEAVDDFLF